MVCAAIVLLSTVDIVCLASVAEILQNPVYDTVFSVGCLMESAAMPSMS